MADPLCAFCRFPGSDLRLEGCGCAVHARCLPISTVLALDGHGEPTNFGSFPAPATSMMSCPACRSGHISGLYLFPLSFEDVERAVEIRKVQHNSNIGSDSGSESGSKNGKRGRSDSLSSADMGKSADCTYMLLSHSRMSGSTLSHREQSRTGRWTDEEIGFVDYLVNAFDHGDLPLPHGIKLNEFLGDILLCKSSRLTKKMKNAKLSARSFELKSPLQHEVNPNCAILSSLQEKFLQSISTEASQLELKFNITKQWRTHFSNLCLQVGYENLDARDWIASLEELERRATIAEENIRKIRQKRMRQALKTDGGSSANPSVFIGGLSASTAAQELEPILSMSKEDTNTRKVSNVTADDPKTSDDFWLNFDSSSSLMGGNGNVQKKRERSFSEDFLQEASETTYMEDLTKEGRGRTFSEDFDAVLNDLIDPAPAVTNEQEDSHSQKTNTTCGPFLDTIIHYMEIHNLKFQHADVWVPSFLPRAGPNVLSVDTDQLRLFNAGHATRGDLDEQLAFTFNEYGVYSEKFSFQPGHGLPGRVYVTGKPSWERNIHRKDPKIFERSGGAKVYGVKTALGIPVDTPLVGRIVVSLYSTFDAPEDPQLVQKCVDELSQCAPAPKWRLVMDSEGNAIDEGAANDPHVGTTQGIMSMKINSQAMQLGGCNPRASGPDNEEQEIITLLGEHMMPGAGSSAGEPSSSSSNLLPHFMSIRLLLLRPEARRSQRENDMIEVLKKSYRAYAKDNRRSGAELASLLAKDWICLKTSFSPQLPLPNSGIQRSSSIASMPASAPYSSLPTSGMQPSSSTASLATATPYPSSQVMAPLMAPYGVATGPMSQPHLSPGPVSPTSSATLGYNNQTPGSTSSLHSNSASFRQESPNSFEPNRFRPESMASLASNAASQNNGTDQKRKSLPNLSPRPLPPKHPNVVLEH